MAVSEAAKKTGSGHAADEADNEAADKAAHKAAKEAAIKAVSTAADEAAKKVVNLAASEAANGAVNLAVREPAAELAQRWNWCPAAPAKARDPIFWSSSFLVAGVCPNQRRRGRQGQSANEPSRRWVLSRPAAAGTLRGPSQLRFGATGRHEGDPVLDPPAAAIFSGLEVKVQRGIPKSQDCGAWGAQSLCARAGPWRARRGHQPLARRPTRQSRMGDPINGPPHVRKGIQKRDALIADALTVEQ